MPTFDKLMGKVQEALGSGVPAGDITKSLRQNAMRARDATQRGALLRAAQAAGDITRANQASLIQTAGLKGTPYQPRTGAGAAIGQGLQEAGQAEAQYQQELSQIERDEQARQDELAKEKKKEAEKTEAESKTIKDLYNRSNQALQYLEKGWKGLLAFQAASLKANTIFGAAYLIPNVDASGVEKRQEAYIDAFLRRQIATGKLSEEAASAFTQLRAVTTQLSASALDTLGPGPKTDFDFIVASRTMADLEQTPRVVADSLRRVRQDAQKWLMKLGQEVPESMYKATIPDYTTEIEWSEPEEPRGGWLGNKIDQGVEKAGELGDKVRTGFETVFKGSGSGTAEDPYVVPSSKWRKQGALNWLEDQSLQGNEIITWKGITGTVNELLEYLQK